MHLPCSIFSQRQLGIFLKVNDVDDVPSVKSMQTLNAMLQKMCRVDSIKYKGALGHLYHVNSLSQIIAQVCIPHLDNPNLMATGDGRSESQTPSQILPRR